MTDDRTFVLTYGESPAFLIRTVEELDAGERPTNVEWVEDED